MIHPRIFRQVIFLAVGLQLIMTLAAFLFPFLDGNVLFSLRLLIALAGGYLYGVDYEGGYTPSAMCGALVGGASVFPAVAVSVLIDMENGSMIPVATGAALLSGGIGGALGAWAAYRAMQEYK